MNKMTKLALALVMILLVMLPMSAMAADLEIATLADLKAFRDAVNAGNNFSGKTVVLTADIDLGNEEWTPIGNASKQFKGHFDGQDHTISNLKITTPNSSNVGFFGFTTNGSVKNLTIKNADIEGYLNVGAVAGTPYTSKYSNITLTGKVTVDGSSYVGSMFGKNLYASASDLTVDVSSGSYVKADSNIGGTNYRTYVGGVVGFIGEGNITLTNVTSNIDVIGTVCDIGGITGIAHYGNKFVNVTCSGDVTVDPAPDTELYDYSEAGGIAGTWMNSNSKVVFDNVSFSGELNQPDGTLRYNDGLVGRRYYDETSIEDSNQTTLNGELVDDNYEEVINPTPTPTPESTEVPAPAVTEAPTAPPSNPVTGDSENLLLWGALLLICGAAMFVLSRKVRA